MILATFAKPHEAIENEYAQIAVGVLLRNAQTNITLQAQQSNVPQLLISSPTKKPRGECEFRVKRF
jgi:hypothetical protein